MTDESEVIVTDVNPTAYCRERVDGRLSHFPIVVEMPGSYHLLTLAAARQLWRDLGRACTDADSSAIRSNLQKESK